ncbi:DUF1566 domain-containing protein [Collimonas fungivorans]|nr:DUF1566 domain-containing protein [Collimonas fungivorans]
MHQIHIKELPALCAALAGGYFGGLFRIDGKLYANIVAGHEGELTGAWNKSLKTVEAARSYSDGLANTDAMVAAGSKLANAARSLRIGGFDDWHIGARDVVELMYRHFKPGTCAENMYRAGDNPSSVPPGYPYTKQSPVQASDPAFQEGGPEALEDSWYWSSTQDAALPDYAWMQYFDNGYQDNNRKSNEYRARAVRRLLVIE